MNWHHYHCSSFRFFRRVGVFVLVFVLRVIVFHVTIYVAILYMNYPRYGAEIEYFQQVLQGGVLVLVTLLEKVWS